MKSLKPLAAVWVIAAAPAAGQAMLADIPLEIITGRGELIVVADVLAAGKPAQMELKLPDSSRPVRTWFRKCSLKVTRVIKERPGATGKATTRPAARRIDVLTRCPKPQPAGMPRIIASDMYYASLAVGQSYVLVLRKIPGREQYYLPSYPKNYRPARKEEVARIERAANVRKWPWGKAVNGLQIAIVPRQARVVLRQMTQRPPRPGGRWTTNAYVQAVVALRNVSNKPIVVSLYPEDRFLSVEATGPGGGMMVPPDFYSRLAMMDLRAFGSWATQTVKPGEILFIGPMGKGDYGLGLNLELSEGKWKLWATYICGRDAKATADTQKLWNGRITSAPVEIQVLRNPRTPGTPAARQRQTAP